MKTRSILTLSTLAVSAMLLIGAQSAKAADVATTTDTAVTSPAPAHEKMATEAKVMKHKAKHKAHKAKVKAEVKTDAATPAPEAK